MRKKVALVKFKENNVFTFLIRGLFNDKLINIRVKFTIKNPTIKDFYEDIT